MELYSRVCDHCGKPFNSGYCIEWGVSYYCSEECLKSEMTWEEFLDLYDDWEGDSYRTEREVEAEEMVYVIKDWKVEEIENPTYYELKDNPNYFEDIKKRMFYIN